ncbi:unnamed protein product [Pleuronectes platessa]|uniref:Uncharacterized protein n=1 Tax=Pleuronectes platessa TaxID=8262 RepID=A0A9N7VDV1_PLEPL|nr:unnamed protein product [Pleuronectes platessa]
MDGNFLHDLLATSARAVRWLSSGPLACQLTCSWMQLIALPLLCRPSVSHCHRPCASDSAEVTNDGRRCKKHQAPQPPISNRRPRFKPRPLTSVWLLRVMGCCGEHVFMDFSELRSL